MSGSLRILRLHAENFKRIKVVDIRPAGDIIQVTGANGSGKSSVLDSIMAALGGAKQAPAEPVRSGASEAIIELDLGAYKVTRRFTRDQVQPPITVTSSTGKKYSSAQALLDEMLGDLAFDPLAFARMKDKEQFEELRRIAKLGPELDELDRLNKIDYDKRRDVNRDAGDRRSAAADIVVPDETPAERVNVAVLVDKMKAVESANTANEQEGSRRLRDAEAIKLYRKEADAAEVQCVEFVAESQRLCAEAVAEMEAQIAAMQKRIAARKLQCSEVVMAKQASVTESVATMRRSADERQSFLDVRQPLPPPSSTFDLEEKIANADFLNSGVMNRQRKVELFEEAERLENESKVLTDRMKERAAKKQAAIEAANLPVSGISLGDGAVLFNGLPFSQASDAERLRVSVAIVMASNPRLRIMRIKDGSLLDSASMAVLAEMAKANDFQLWIEAVDESGQVGFVMEDGAIVANNVTQEMLA